MTFVKTAQFKSRLSHYLSCVRNGDEVVVTDRKTPIARVIPYDARSEALAITPAKGSPRGFKKLRIPPPRPGTNSLRALLKDREDDLEV